MLVAFAAAVSFLCRLSTEDLNLKFKNFPMPSLILPNLLMRLQFFIIYVAIDFLEYL